MSTPSQEIIDLTDDHSPAGRHGLNTESIFGPTPPRDHRSSRVVPDVISIDENDVPEYQTTLGSPELEYMFSRTLLPTAMPEPRQRLARQLNNRGSTNMPDVIDANSRQTNNGHNLLSEASWAEWRSRGHPNQAAQRAAHVAAHERHRRHHAHDPIVRAHAEILGEVMNRGDSMFINEGPNMNLPGHLDFLAQGFQMGPRNHINNGIRQPPPPTYDPPSPPRQGYTRTPKEDEVMVCPNCDEELGVGDNEIKKQVWVIKRCGHVGILRLLVVTRYSLFLKVYCGDCTKNRQKAGRVKGELVALPKPFAKCVVDGCANRHPVSHQKSLFQIFL